MQDIIDAKLNRGGFGVEGYTIRKYNPFLDKTKVPKIVKGQKTTYLDQHIKINSLVQVGKLNMSGDILDKKKKSSIPKSPRYTLATEIEKMEKKSP